MLILFGGGAGGWGGSGEKIWKNDTRYNIGGGLGNRQSVGRRVGHLPTRAFDLGTSRSARCIKHTPDVLEGASKSVVFSATIDHSLTEARGRQGSAHGCFKLLVGRPLTVSSTSNPSSIWLVSAERLLFNLARSSLNTHLPAKSRV